MLVADRQNPDPKRSASTVSFAAVTREIARRNDEAQKVARTKRAAHERERIAARRLWEHL